MLNPNAGSFVATAGSCAPDVAENLVQPHLSEGLGEFLVSEVYESDESGSFLPYKDVERFRTVDTAGWNDRFNPSSRTDVLSRDIGDDAVLGENGQSF